ncbi:MAG: imidazole glycerol phosphate synthase subunit HisH [Cytophagales bacterium]|nr:imidazole glycerol phosphate synthase subunit HisH [Cytophagales bacterium]
MSTAIVKYNAGNIQSVTYALNRLGVEPLVTDDPSELQSADKVIFPGVGEASTAMAYLRERGLDQVIKNLKQPVLGICLGQQLLCSHSEENDATCLGIFDIQVKKFVDTKNEGFKIPLIGWNSVYNLQSKLYDGIPEESFMYFVHSFYVEKSKYSISYTGYSQEFSSALQKDNFFAVQYHPEKSGEVGSRLLENFLKL